MEKCIKCEKDSVITIQNGNLCKKHFVEYFEKKVRKTIRKYELINRKDKVCLALSGGKDSLSLLHFMKEYSKELDIPLFVLFIDEGVSSKGLDLYDKIKKRYETEYIKFYKISFKEVFGFNLDEIIEKADGFKKKPCSVCGTLRRYLLNYYSRKLGATVILTGHTQDDHAQAFLMNLIKGNLEKNFALGPVAGCLTDEKFTKRSKPLYFTSEEEIKKYCEVQGIEIIKKPCEYSDDSQRGRIKKALNDLESEFPATKSSIVKSFVGFLDDYKALLIEKKGKEYASLSDDDEKTYGESIASCRSCGEPTSEDVCNTCKLVEQLGGKITFKELKN